MAQAQVSVKMGDYGPGLVTSSVGFDFSTNYSVFASSRDTADGTVLYCERDITGWQSSGGNPAGGIVALPQFSGRGLPGAVTTGVVIAAGDTVTITAVAGPAGTVRQEVYATLAGGTAPTLFLLGAGPDGWLAAGRRFGDPDFPLGSGEWEAGKLPGRIDSLQNPGADEVLVQPAPTIDESTTQGDTVAIGTTAITSAIVASPGDGTFSGGTYEFAVVNLRDPDSSVERVVEIEWELWDHTGVQRQTLPQSGFIEVAYVAPLC